MHDSEWKPDDESSDDDPVIVPCPYCGEEILEDAPQCPACGNYLSEEDRPREKKPPWILVGVVICLVIALLWAAGK